MNGTNYEVPHCGAFSIPPPFTSLSDPNIRLRIRYWVYLRKYFCDSISIDFFDGRKSFVLTNPKLFCASLFHMKQK